MFRSFFGVLIFLGLLAGSSLHAQTHPLAKRIVLTGENVPAANRLWALDRQMDLLRTPSAIGQCIAWSAPPFPLRPFAAMILDAGELDKWDQLLDDYQKLNDDAGDALVPMHPGNARSGLPPPNMSVRRLIHLRIAALPPSILRRYRQRVDVPAQKLFEEGKEQHSAVPLRRLVDEFFCSRWAEPALDLLGDLAFEEGNFEDALAWWCMLALPPLEENHSGLHTLVFPNPLRDTAHIQAKEILAHAYLNQRDRARHELLAFEKIHPKAKGFLAGKDGPFSNILNNCIDRLAEHSLETNQEAWTTFAGNSARNRSLAVCPPARLWQDDPTWKVRLPNFRKPGFVAAPLSRTNPANRLAYHPLVVNNQVLIGDNNSVVSYQLFTGRELFRFLSKDVMHEEPNSGRQNTLTAYKDRLFARLGGQNLGPKSAEDKEQSASNLVCLSLAEANQGALLWQIFATTPDKQRAFFEGSPLASENMIFSAMSWVIGQQTHTALVCHDAQTGQRRWFRPVCVTPEFEDNREPRKRQHLLTLGGGRLYYCSHAGSVLALDPWSGQWLWGTRY